MVTESSLTGAAMAALQASADKAIYERRCEGSRVTRHCPWRNRTALFAGTLGVDFENLRMILSSWAVNGLPMETQQVLIGG